MEIILNIGLYHYLILALILFCIGVFGVVVCKNIIKILICIELMLSAVAINFAAFACYTDTELLNGLVFALFIIVFGAAQVALAVALWVSICRYKNIENTEEMGEMKG